MPPREPPQFTIPENELIMTTARSGGAGGQNVNKRDTKVHLWWSPAASSIFTPEEKETLMQNLAAQLENGSIHIERQTERTQEGNKREAILELHRRVATGLVVPKKRRPTKPSKAAKNRRLDDKAKVSRRKQERRDRWEY